ncbi:MAG: formate--tetrahydrofolate ligase [Flaviflexus sp.]|uniref:formate--tetrahydrofolate ligase n=1 Tax=Flaviflexus sp. TaxID=1969482 RepID=UPI00352D848E
MSTTFAPISDVARQLGIPDEALFRYGHDKAKVDSRWVVGQEVGEARLVLVTAMSPTPAGEGKTTTSIGLADGLRKLGENAVLALREPSMGPVFGMKGGATGGGKASLHPEADINLHFTGDFAALSAANNLLVALIDNHLHHGNESGLDPQSVTMRRALDVNDRTLRNIVTSLGGRANGVLRETGFDITAASQLMAILCLAESIKDLKERLARIVVGDSIDGEEITVGDLGFEGALVALLKDAFSPNLVQTLEGTPAFVHGGPFANIAHGCNSVIATKAALATGDIVITEAGFGADLGAEKFIDIKARQTGIKPDLSVVVATVRALKYHGGMGLDELEHENMDALREGIANLLKHVRNLQDIFGQTVLVAINQFASDRDSELEVIEQELAPLGVRVVTSSHFANGGEGARDLARAVLQELATPSATTFCYDDDTSLQEKALIVASKVYGAGAVTWTPAAKREILKLERRGYGNLPICMAKNQYSFAAEKVLGAPTGHTIPIREVRLSAGAGFVVLIVGSIMTMPGLPARPSALDIDVVDGEIVGIH